MTITEFFGIIIIIISNVWGGDHASPQYEKTTALFGITGTIALCMASFGSILSNFIFAYKDILFSLSFFCLSAAFSRDWEKLAHKIKELFSKRQ
jgi:hypothetical protein